MVPPIRRPEEILAYRTIREILAPRQRELWTLAPTDTVLRAVELMDEKDIGCVLVLQQGAPVGVVSERDCVRRVLLAGKSPGSMQLAEIMVRDVVACAPDQTFAECLRLMHRHGVRHLPVIEGGRAVGMVSMRDLAAEAVAHHAKLIAQIERERLEIYTSQV
jgi:CBS domain-containing protein